MPIEISTRDAAVSDYFYGGPETGVEDAFANVEDRFSALLQSLDQGELPENLAEDLRLFIWTLAVRTRAVRDQLGGTANVLFDQMATTITPDQALPAVLEWLDLQFDRVIKDTLQDLLKEVPAPQREVIQNVLSMPDVRQHLLHLSRDQARSTDVGGIFRWMLREFRNQNHVAVSSKGGQIRSLSSLLEKGKAPESFRPDH